MKQRLILLLLFVFALPIAVNAAGGFNVSSSSISMYPGESKTITITTSNSVGRLNISSTNSGIASVNTGSVFIQNPGSSANITITGKAVGTATISVIASDNYATMDEEILAGQKRTITVTVKQKSSTNTNNNNNNNSNNTIKDTRSKNNNLKDITIDGYKLTKVNNNNYTLTVSNDVASINIKATAEDSKAKITGTGTRELKVGENNLELIVTAENGSQNKIIIKVTRKDGYYLEDLDTLLNNDKISDINITINSDTKISLNDLEKIKNSKKTVKFNYYDKDKKLKYSWTVDGSKINNTSDLITTVSFESENKKEMMKSSNYADGLYIGLTNTKEGTKLKIYVGDKYSDGEEVNIYAYSNGKLTQIDNSLKVENGYVEYELMGESDYLITMSKVNNSKSGLNLIQKDTESTLNYKLFTVILGLLNIVLIVIIIVLLKKKKQKKH